MEETLKNKGHKFVANYMNKKGWILVNFDEDTMTAEYSLTHAGVTLKNVFITFTEKWRVKEVRK